MGERKAVVPLAVGHEGEVLGVALGEAVEVPETGEAVAAGNVGGLEPVTHDGEVLFRTAGVVGGLAGPGAGVDGNLAVDEVGIVEDQRFGQGKGSFLRHDGPRFAGEVEAAVCEAFEKLVDAEEGRPFVEVGPDAGLEASFGEGVLRIMPGDEDSVPADFDGEGLLVVFRGIDPGFGAPPVESEVNVHLAGNRRLGDGDRRAEDLPEEFGQLLRGKAGRAVGFGRNDDVGVFAVENQRGLADPADLGQAFGHVGRIGQRGSGQSRRGENGENEKVFHGNVSFDSGLTCKYGKDQNRHTIPPNPPFFKFFSGGRTASRPGENRSQ